MKRIMGDWLHWSCRSFHFGFHRYGNCWTFAYHKQEYYNCIHYSFWRVFIAFDKTPDDLITK